MCFACYLQFIFMKPYFCINTLVGCVFLGYFVFSNFACRLKSFWLPLGRLDDVSWDLSRSWGGTYIIFLGVLFVLVGGSVEAFCLSETLLEFLLEHSYFIVKKPRFLGWLFLCESSESQVTLWFM